MKISIKYHIPAVKLEFVNINLSKDNKIFLDPLKIRRGTSDFDIKCYQKIDVFIKLLLKLVRNRDYQSLIEIIDNLYERNETRLGYSLETTYGKSMGANGGRDLIKLLAKEEMVKNGEVEDIIEKREYIDISFVYNENKIENISYDYKNLSFEEG